MPAWVYSPRDRDKHQMSFSSHKELCNAHAGLHKHTSPLGLSVCGVVGHARVPCHHGSAHIPCAFLWLLSLALSTPFAYTSKCRCWLCDLLGEVQNLFWILQPCTMIPACECVVIEGRKRGVNAQGVEASGQCTRLLQLWRRLRLFAFISKSPAPWDAAMNAWRFPPPLLHVRDCVLQFDSPAVDLQPDMQRACGGSA